mgnify:CR=1 FL=1
MISKIERIIAFRDLKPKKKEGFLKVISVFSFMGIALGVAILIIVMSVMNGFKTELTKKKCPMQVRRLHAGEQDLSDTIARLS